MGFFDYVALVTMLLQREGRLTYRALQREFGFDAAWLDDLRRELIFRRVACDEQGEGLVWTGVVPLAGQSAAPEYAAQSSPEAMDLPPLNLTTEPPSPDAARLSTTVSPMSLGTLRVAASDALFAEPHMERYEPPSTASGTDATAAAPAPLRTVSEAERRQLTVMSCDLVGSTHLSGQLDPEDLREIVRAYQEAAALVIQRYEGHIAQYLGDGMLVYFGYPMAHEDDAQRAVRSGLDIVEAIQALNTRLQADSDVQLAVRIGIHTGRVVVVEMGGDDRHDQLALGETPNIAAQIEALAQPGTVVISNVTAQLVQRAFVLEELGARELEGAAGPMRLTRVVGPLEADDASGETIVAGFETLVGRDEESGLLLRRWEQSKEGLGQVVLINGEAGYGKSSLVEGLRQHIDREDVVRIVFRSSPYTQQSALYPVIAQTQRILGWQPNDAVETRLAKLERVLQGYRLPLQETVPLLALLLSLPLPEDRYPDLGLTSQQQRQQTQDAVVALFLEESERQPVLTVWEDLHWADPSTLELLGLLIEQTPTAPMLHVLTFRPEFEPCWPMRSHMTPITLNPLERSQVELLVTRFTEGKTLPAAVVEHIVSKTDGVPLYAEELTKMLRASELLCEKADRYELTGTLLSVAIPDTLQDSLMARLDQLNEAKEIAQLGAVLGRTFPYDMLKALWMAQEEILQQGLSKLVEAELLYQRGQLPQARYIFKHALIQDAAYASLLRQKRQQMHQQIAELLEAQFPETLETQPELVAHHYTEAGKAEQAVTYWQKAGERAVQRSDHAEAIAHLTQGLALIPSLPDTQARTQRELMLNVTLGAPLLATKGYAAPEVGRVYTRARELCQQAGETPQLVQVIFGLWMFYAVRAEFRTALDLAEQLYGISQRQSEPTQGLEAQQALGITAAMRGALLAARDHLEEGAALYDPQHHRAHAFLYGQDSKVVCLCHLSVLLWLLGYPDQARQRSHEARVLAEELPHALSQSWALLYTAMVHALCRERREVQSWAVALIDLCSAQGFAYRLVQGRLLQSWADVALGQDAADMGSMRQDLTAINATGAEVYYPYYLALLAQAYGETGQTAEGLSALSEAVGFVKEHEERWYEAELHRLRGVLLLQQSVPDVTRAETCFRQALDIAREQKAKSWELRAALSLSRLWQQQSKQNQARALLTPIYAWFAEGFDTADLRDAQALLKELG
ncbi:MAG: AAA family ATPase [Candidatus Tectomicrobia bacterium]|nr:AAA family ATPase [Candidatus Tectomicrobia bacterium]